MKINPRVVIVREAIAKIVEMLAFRKMRVTQEGVQAYVRYHPKSGEPELVNLPYLPDDASNDLIDATQGFLDHECGHLLFSTFPALKKSVEKGPSFASLVNILEDTYVERKMAERFAGSGANLSSVGRFVWDTVIAPKLKEIDPRNEAELLRMLLMPAIRAWSGQHLWRDLMKPHWASIEEFVKRMNSAAPPIEDLIKSINHSDDSLKVAEEIMKRGMPPEAEGGTGGREGAGSGAGGAGAGASGPPPEEAKSGGAGAEGSDDDAPAPEVRKRPKKPKKMKSSGEPIGGGDTSIYAGEEEGKPKDPITEALTGFDDDFDSLASEAIASSAAAASSGTGYLVWSTDHDSVETMPVDKDFATNPSTMAAMKRMLDKVDHMIGPMQKDVERAVAARSASVMIPGFRSGKLHGAALTRLRFDRDDVFRRKTENRTKDVAVGLVVDASGSMSSKIETAAYAAYALSSVLDRLNIPNEVTSFTTGDLPAAVAKRMHEDCKKMAELGGRKVYSRTEPLNIAVIKEFHERINARTRERFVTLANFYHGGLANNVDGESVQVAHRRLMKHKATRKVLIVLSDGQPAAAGVHKELVTHLKAVVKEIQKSGTDVVGIGIMDGAVRDYYPKHVVLSNVSDLPGQVMRELKQLLTPRI